MKREWERKRLGDLFIFKNGRAFKKEEWATEGLPIIRIQNLNNKDASFNHFAGEYSRDILVEPGDLLFSWSGTVGSSFGSHLWNGETGVLNQHIFKIGLRENIEKRYAFHGLRYITEEIEQSVNGAVGLVHITKEKLNDFTIPVPPLPEQQRIVGVLDEAFEGLATAKANAEKNLQNARALFESHLQAIFTPGANEWPTKQLGDVCDFEGGSQPPKSQFIYSPKAGYVRFLQIRDFTSEKHVTFIPESKKNRLCDANDIMIGRYGASVGKILTGKAGAYNVALMKTIPDTSCLDCTFFYHYLVSRAFQERLANVASRSAQNGFSKEDIYGFPVPVPSLSEQQKVIAQLTPLSEETQRLARIYEQKLSALEALKKSLLHQAFAGEL
jgi:type I restriction enzyme S subunit